MVEIAFKLQFIRTNSNSNEPNPLMEEMNNFFLGLNSKGIQRYVAFIRGLYIIDYLGFLPEQIKPEDCQYCTSGVMIFKLDIDSSFTTDEILELLKMGDSLWEGIPGEVAVFPVRSTVFKSKLEELGYFDHRISGKFSVM